MPATASTTANTTGSNRINQGKGRTSKTQPNTNSVRIRNRVADFRTMGPIPRWTNRESGWRLTATKCEALLDNKTLETLERRPEDPIPTSALITPMAKSRPSPRVRSTERD